MRKFGEPPGNIADLLPDLKNRGYLCIKYRDTTQNCDAYSFKIKQFIKKSLLGCSIFNRVVKVYRLLFMELSRIIIIFISNMCIYIDVLSWIYHRSSRID
ncbi:hypothetical protein RF11_04093 [Thelohanellus kitauei]|uniref:Uncharacterized protein n=1 Tax=Thelohanellus kitauei TaxID=669202 RepID=A0A0C2IDE6_THEKT|nr:hypothetical protein RF11_04093 [Thelohanellus kitauei]